MVDREGGRRLTAARRTVPLANVNIREQGQRLPELPKDAPQLMSLVREGYRKPPCASGCPP